MEKSLVILFEASGFSDNKMQTVTIVSSSVSSVTHQETVEISAGPILEIELYLTTCVVLVADFAYVHFTELSVYLYCTCTVLISGHCRPPMIKDRHHGHL